MYYDVDSVSNHTIFILKEAVPFRYTQNINIGQFRSKYTHNTMLDVLLFFHIISLPPETVVPRKQYYVHLKRVLKYFMLVTMYSFFPTKIALTSMRCF